MTRLSNITLRKDNEGILSYYKRLKQLVADGDIELEKSEIYSLLFPSLELVSADHARKSLRVLDLVLVSEDSASICEMSDMAPTNRVSTSINNDGTQSSSRIVKSDDKQIKDCKFLLEAHGYSTGEWDIVSAKNSIYDTQAKGGNILTLYSSKITVKPRKNEFDYEKMLKSLEEFAKSYVPSREITPRQYKYGSEVLVPCLFDVHFAKLADIDECGEKYNYKIAKQRVLDSVRGYVNRLSGRTFEKVIFVIGNDFFNSESNGETVHNTKQDNDSRYGKMFNKGVETLIEAIDMLAAVAPVDVMLVQGNHSLYTEFYASCVLGAWYKDSNIVHVDSTPSARKYVKFGKNLLGFTHGSEEKDRIYGLMQCEAAADWGVTTTHEWLIGHLHCEGVVEKNGVVVRRIPSLTSPDAWLYKTGYTMSKKRTMAFIYDKEQGLMETHYINI